MFLLKERKRTQRTERSFEKNGCHTLLWRTYSITAIFRKLDTFSLKDILLQYSESLSLILWRTYYCNIQKVWHSLSEGHITAIFRKLDMNFHTEEHITLIFRKPVTFSLKDILYYYCNFQKDLKSISEGHTVLLYSNIQKAWEFFS